MAVSVFSPTFDEKSREFFFLTSGNNSIRVGMILSKLEKFQGFSGGRSRGVGQRRIVRHNILSDDEGIFWKKCSMTV